MILKKSGPAMLRIVKQRLAKGQRNINVVWGIDF